MKDNFRPMRAGSGSMADYNAQMHKAEKQLHEFAEQQIKTALEHGCTVERVQDEIIITTPGDDQ